jgi:hypothetical protein
VDLFARQVFPIGEILEVGRRGEAAGDGGLLAIVCVDLAAQLEAYPPKRRLPGW